MAAEKPSSKGQAWFCTTGLPSDIVVEVDDMTFHLHKFPLMSKSKKFFDLITEEESKYTSAETYKRQQPEEDASSPAEAAAEAAEDVDPDSAAEAESCQISLLDFPGGSDAFEAAAKFCYGVKIELSAANVVPLRCAGEALEMTEEYSEDNLISKTERFLSHTVFRNIKDSIKALKSCENLIPPAEELGIVERCVDAIASKAALVDPSLFGWPVNEGDSGPGDPDENGSVLRRKSKGGRGRGGVGGGSTAEPWFEDLSILCSDLFDRVIRAMKEREISSEVIESCLIHYAKKCFPGVSRSYRKPSSSTPTPATNSSPSTAVTESEQRDLLEKIAANLPTETSSTSNHASRATTRTLFGLLRTANILNASESCKSTLERKIGTQLEQATLDDLLIPSYSYLNETLYDVECVERILGCFLRERLCGGGSGGDNLAIVDYDNVIMSRTSSAPAVMLVGKLIDGFLSEIASDGNLKPEKFYELAVLLPEQARLYDDGLYRAVDVYLKAHPWISEDEREKLCGVMNCQKLTLEACTHAAQNERLPLRAIVQVLFFEQLQLRHAIAGTLIAAGASPDLAVNELHRSPVAAAPTPGRELAVTTAVGEGEGTTWRRAVRENQVLRLDMDSMKARVHELERECSTMRKAIENARTGPPQDGGGERKKSSSSFFARKFGCKFKTQVCDSQESTVVERRKGRSTGGSHGHHHRR